MSTIVEFKHRTIELEGKTIKLQIVSLCFSFSSQGSLVILRTLQSYP